MRRLPPVELQRLYAKDSPSGDFVIVAKPLSAAMTAHMTDEEHIARREAERRAIDAEWARIRSASPRHSEEE